MGNCCGKPQQEFHDDRSEQRESRLVTLDDETTQAPEMPTTGPPRIIPIEELQNSKKEFMKNRKTFIMSILDKNKNKQAKKPKKLVEEEEPEEVLDEEIEEKHQIEEEQHPVQLQTLEDSEDSDDSDDEPVIKKVETPKIIETSPIRETKEPVRQSRESPITIKEKQSIFESPKPKESPLRQPRDVQKTKELSPIVTISKQSKESPLASPSVDSSKKTKDIISKTKESPKPKESPLVTKSKDSPLVSKKIVESPKTKESPLVATKSKDKESIKSIESPQVKKKKTESIDTNVNDKRKSIEKDTLSDNTSTSTSTTTTASPEKKPKGETTLCNVVIAAYPYYGRTERELSFSPGEEIAVVQKIDPWWRGMSLKTNDFGWFPNNFVKASEKQVSVEVVPEVSENYTYETRQKEESHIIKLSRKIAPGIATLRKMLQTTTTAAMWKD